MSIVKLRTGRVKPVEHAQPLKLAVASRAPDGEFELLELKLPALENGVSWARAEVKAPSATLAFTTLGASAGSPAIWLRLPKTAAESAIDGEIFTSSADFYAEDIASSSGHHFRFHADADAAKSTPNIEIRRRFYGALADWLGRNGVSGFFPFANERVQGIVEPTPAEARKRRATLKLLFPKGAPHEVRSDLRELMDTTTGRHAIELAIQSRRPLFADLMKERASIKLADLKPPQLPRADYAALLKRLARAVPDEPLARLVPADFYYLRAKGLVAFLDLLELAEDWGEPAADLLDGEAVERGTALRYQAELGLVRGELTRALGPEVVDSLALVGSDPYIHEGSDVTCLFRIKNQPLFDAALTAAMTRYAAQHGGVTATKASYEGVALTVTRSADGRVRQHRAHVADVEFVSNSRRALERVLAAALGKAPKLADEADFRYLLARDSEVPADVLGALSDRFVLSVIGPAQKIGEVRRLFARAELDQVANGALLFGLLDGRSPRDLAELVQRKLLTAGELRHWDGIPIAFTANQGPSSAWGSPAALEPLLDRPPIERVTPSESESYQQFASYYASLWSDYVDPVMLRATRVAEKPLRERVFLRALPLLSRENREIVETVGDARVSAPELAQGMRAVLGLGKDSELRALLSGAANSYGQHFAQSFKFDWLGDHVVLGVTDRAQLANFVYEHDVLERRGLLEPPSTQRPGHDDDADPLLDALSGVYAVVGLNSATGAVIALEALRATLGHFEWHSPEPYRDVSVVDVELHGASRHIYYAICPRALVVAFHRPTLERLIDDELAGRAPAAASAKDARRGQLVLDLKKNPGGAIEAIMTWWLARRLVEGSGTSSARAEAVLRGLPSARADADAFRRGARAHLGSIPLTPEGKLFELAAEGVRDPDRGSDYAPIFPALPVADSPLARALGRFSSLRSELAFEREGALADTDGRPLRSFRADVMLELGAAKR